MFGELEDAYDRASEDPECHVIVISGEGRCWSSGDDANGLTPESAPCLVTYETRDELLERYDSESAFVACIQHRARLLHHVVDVTKTAARFRSRPSPWCTATACMAHFPTPHTATSFSLPRMRCSWAGGPAADQAGTWAHARDWSSRMRTGTCRLKKPTSTAWSTVSSPTARSWRGRRSPSPTVFANEVPSALKRIKAGYLNTLDHQGYRAAFDSTRSPFNDTWRTWAKDGQPHRFEGRGIARTPVSYYNLTQKLLGEGKEVPEHIIEALQRAVVRDDKGAWEKALHQEGREPERVARADAAAQAWQERLAREGKRDIKDMIQELLEQQEWVR